MNRRLQWSLCCLQLVLIGLLANRLTTTLLPKPTLTLVPSAARRLATGPDWPLASADRGGSIQSILDESAHTWWYGQLPEDGPLVFSVSPLEPQRIGMLRIESAEHRQPTGLRLDVRKQQNSELVTVADWQIVTDEESITLSIPEELRSDIAEYRFSITGTKQADKLTRINEVRFFEAIERGGD